MMKWVFGLMIIVSVVFGIITGRIGDVGNAVLNEGVNAVELYIYMLGGICVWGGVMRIAEKSGLTEKLAHLFTPIAKIIFSKLDFNGKAFRAICMNVTANLLGLGNAATPLGLEAMKELEKEEVSKGHDPTQASNNMIIFTVLNTASITLIPTTVAALRLKHGAENPLDVLGGVLAVSLISVTVSLLLAKILNMKSK